MLPAVQKFIDRLIVRASDPDAERQVGAIPYAVINEQVVFLLITSRRTGRWIFPKGAIIPGMTAWDSAGQEALEEAGVTGTISETPIGAYRTIKTRALRRHVVEVDMYPLLVTEQRDEWQEKVSRHRHWVLLPEAKRLLSDPRLAELATVVGRQALGQSQAAKKRITW
jgi:8-oxo-dGTP pyrophosphatase MutT (NUDIX family)